MEKSFPARRNEGSLTPPGSWGLLRRIWINCERVCAFYCVWPTGQYRGSESSWGKLFFPVRSCRECR